MNALTFRLGYKHAMLGLGFYRHRALCLYGSEATRKSYFEGYWRGLSDRRKLGD